MSALFPRSVPARFSFYAGCTLIFAAAAGFAGGAFPQFPWKQMGDFRNETLWHETFPQSQTEPWKESIELAGREIYVARISGMETDPLGVAFLHKMRFRGRAVILLLEIDRHGRLGSLQVLEHHEPVALMREFWKQPLVHDFLPGKNLQELDQAILEGQVPQVPKMRAFSRELALAVREGLKFWDAEKEVLAERLGLERADAVELAPLPVESLLSSPIEPAEEIRASQPLPPVQANQGHGRE